MTIDGTKSVRQGEELDASALFKALVEPLSAALDVKIEGPITIRQFPSGHSNLTYLLEVRAAGRSEPIELVLRRPPFGNVVKTAHDMGREYRILSALSKAGYAKAPRPLVHIDDASVIGAPFYVMERVTGVVLRRKLPEGISLDAAGAARLATTFMDGFVELHALPWADIGLADFGKPEGYAERQVRGWAKRYEDAKTDEIPSMERVAVWLLANVPKPDDERARATIVHNDFKYDNLVFHPDLARDPAAPIIGVLDWEMATIGDPILDLATSLAYWVEATDPDPLKAFAFGPTHVEGSPTRRELCARYAAQSGRDTSGIVFAYAFALFKNAVVAQQIYSRFKKGLTKDERFGMFILGVQMLGEASSATIDRGEL